MLRLLGGPRKDVEDLLQRSLRGRVFLNVELLFDVLHHTEHKPNRLAVATDLEGVGVAEMLD